MGKLLLFYKTMASVGGTIAIVNIGPEIYTLMKQLKLDTVFDLSAK